MPPASAWSTMWRIVWEDSSRSVRQPLARGPTKRATQCGRAFLPPEVCDPPPAAWSPLLHMLPALGGGCYRSNAPLGDLVAGGLAVAPAQDGGPCFSRSGWILQFPFLLPTLSSGGERAPWTPRRLH